jgi:hypothetical protein
LVTSPGTIMVKSWGDFASSSEGGTTPMEVFTATTAAGEPPRPRRVLMTRSGAMGALAARVGWRHGKICSGRDHHDDTVEKC